jgi:hypothetical protein
MSMVQEALELFDALKDKPAEVVLTVYVDPENFGDEAGQQNANNALLANELNQRGVKVLLKPIRWADYKAWLREKPDTPDQRAKFAGLPTRLGLSIYTDHTGQAPRSAIGWALFRMEEK